MNFLLVIVWPVLEYHDFWVPLWYHLIFVRSIVSITVYFCGVNDEDAFGIFKLFLSSLCVHLYLQWKCQIFENNTLLQFIFTRLWRLLWFMLLNSTFNNTSVISWWSVILVEETGVPGENHRTVASHWQTLSHNVVSNTPLREWVSNSQH